MADSPGRAGASQALPGARLSPREGQPPPPPAGLNPRRERRPRPTPLPSPTPAQPPRAAPRAKSASPAPFPGRAPAAGGGSAQRPVTLSARPFPIGGKAPFSANPGSRFPFLRARRAQKRSSRSGSRWGGPRGRFCSWAAAPSCCWRWGAPAVSPCRGPEGTRVGGKGQDSHRVRRYGPLPGGVRCGGGGHGLRVPFPSPCKIHLPFICMTGSASGQRPRPLAALCRAWLRIRAFFFLLLLGVPPRRGPP